MLALTRLNNETRDGERQMTLMNKVEKITVGKVVFNHLNTGQVGLTEVDWAPPGYEIHVTIYGKDFPPIGSRVAFNFIGQWMDADHFVDVVVAVADMIDKLEVSDETQRSLVNMVVRHQMEAAHQARLELQAQA